MQSPKQKEPKAERGAIAEKSQKARELGLSEDMIAKIFGTN